MSEQQAKRRKVFHSNKPKNYYNQKSRKQFMEPGQRGFLATCNFREKDCIRECYNILNQYADELYGPQTKKSVSDPSTTTPELQSEEADITDELAKEISEVKADAKEQKSRFRVVESDTNNCIFIKTTIEDPVELGVRIVQDIAKTQIRKTRYLLRLVPISVICRANMKDIIDAAGALFDKHFLKESHTFSIIFNRRYNNSIMRDDVIKDLAELVAAKNTKNKVDLKNPELSVVVEVIKGLCCLSVIPEYVQMKRFNLVELAGKGEGEIAEVNEKEEEVTEANEKEEEVADADAVKTDEENDEKEIDETTAK